MYVFFLQFLVKAAQCETPNKQFYRFFTYFWKIIKFITKM